ENRSLYLSRYYYKVRVKVVILSREVIVGRFYVISEGASKLANYGRDRYRAKDRFSYGGQIDVRLELPWIPDGIPKGYAERFSLCIWKAGKDFIVPVRLPQR